jgi:hypothetical protein
MVCEEDTMSTRQQAEGLVWVHREPRRKMPSIKVILAYIIGLLALSPAILGIHWEWVLP